MVVSYHLAPRVVQHHNGVGVGGDFGLERKVLLDLGLQVGGVLGRYSLFSFKSMFILGKKEGKM